MYGAIAEGLNLIWGVMKVVNAAHGDFVIVGAYLSYWTFVFSGLNPFLLVMFSIPFGFLLGAVMYFVLVRRVIQKADPRSMELMTLLLTFGLSTFVSSFLLYLYTPTERGITVMLPPITFAGLVVPSTLVAVAVYAVATIGALHLFLKKTFWGRAMRAVAEDRQSALIVGINPDVVSFLAFGIGIAITASIGSMVIILQSVTPVTGTTFTNLSFVVAVLGGLGNPFGALISGVLIGVINNVSSIWINAAATPAIGFIILLIVLIIKPSGILGSM